MPNSFMLHWFHEVIFSNELRARNKKTYFTTHIEIILNIYKSVKELFAQKAGIQRVLPRGGASRSEGSDNLSNIIR